MFEGENVYSMSARIFIVIGKSGRPHVVETNALTLFREHPDASGPVWARVGPV